MPVGRPSLYNAEVADSICVLISQGKSLTSICQLVDMPSFPTVMNWLGQEDRKEFLDKYTRARESQADYLAEEIIDISDNGALQADDRRIRIDTRKWYAGKVRPKKYSDKQIIAGDPDAPINHHHTGKIDMGAELIASAIERILGKNEKDTNDIPT